MGINSTGGEKKVKQRDCLTCQIDCAVRFAVGRHGFLNSGDVHRYLARHCKGYSPKLSSVGAVKVTQ